MPSFNSCTFVGNLTRDAETKIVGETEVAAFGVAINGKSEGDVMYIDCDLWRPGRVTEFLTRGTPVLVSGPLKVRQWEKDGQTKFRLQLDCKTVQLLGGKRRPEPADEAEMAF
jgi:single-stranded DNA-binding protein